MFPFAEMHLLGICINTDFNIVCEFYRDIVTDADVLG